MPVVDSLRSVGKVADIDASGTAEDVFAATCQVIEQLEQQVPEQQQQQLEAPQQDQPASPVAAAAAPTAVAATSANGFEGAAGVEVTTDINQHQPAADPTEPSAPDFAATGSVTPAAGAAATSAVAELASSAVESGIASDTGSTALAAEGSSTGSMAGKAAEDDKTAASDAPPANASIASQSTASIEGMQVGG